MTALLAIDFETCHKDPDSACAIGMVAVRGGKIRRQYSTLLRPPARSEFMFTDVHGLTAIDVAEAPPIAQLEPLICAEINEIIQLGGMIVAHNACFDQRVLHASLPATRSLPATWLCTYELVKALFPKPAWEKHTLSYASEQLGIMLSHHDPLSDARASAIIAARILSSGVDVTRYLRAVTRPNVKAAPAG